jgi:hypothetical protein
VTDGPEFTDGFGTDFDITGETVVVPTAVRLELFLAVDDHVRSKDPLWQHFAHPKTQIGLYLYRDGTVLQTTQWDAYQIQAADDWIAGGHVWYGGADSWQAQVLRDAGYTLIPVEWTNQPFEPVPDSDPDGAHHPVGYGVGPYGLGPWGG